MLTKTAIDRLTGGLLLALGVALFVALATDHRSRPHKA